MIGKLMAEEANSLRTVFLREPQTGFHRQNDEERPEEASRPVYDWLGRLAAENKLGGRTTMLFTIGNICLWFTAFFGMFFNMVLFFQEVLGKGTAASANNTNNWLGSMFLSSLIGALVAESYLGRLWTCALFQLIAVLGMVLTALATTSLVSVDSSTGIVSFFYLSIYMISVGCGAFQPTLQSLGADQFDTDGDKATFFTRYLAINNLGIALGDTLIVYLVDSKGWVLGFYVCAIVGTAGTLLFLCGLPIYRQYKQKGNPYVRILQVLVAAARKWRLPQPTENDELYNEGEEYKHVLSHTNSLRWLDKAAFIMEDDAQIARGDKISRDRWKLSSMTEVEELKSVIRLLPVWGSSIFFNTVYSQAGTLFVEEGETMDTSMGNFTMAPAAMNMFNILAVVLLPPVYTAIIAPLARRVTKHPRGLSPLHRMAGGYVLAILSLSLAAFLEMVRLQYVHQALSPPSIFWQVPQFLLLGAAQFLAGVGQLEFFYSYSPPALRSLGSSLCLTCIALGDYVSSILVSLVTLITTQGGQAGWISKDLDEGHLDYFFWLLAGLALLNLLLFIVCSRSFTQQLSNVTMVLTH